MPPPDPLSSATVSAHRHSSFIALYRLLLAVACLHPSAFLLRTPTPEHPHCFFPCAFQLRRSHALRLPLYCLPHPAPATPVPDTLPPHFVAPNFLAKTLINLIPGPLSLALSFLPPPFGFRHFPLLLHVAPPQRLQLRLSTPFTLLPREPLHAFFQCFSVAPSVSVTAAEAGRLSSGGAGTRAVLQVLPLPSSQHRSQQPAVATGLSEAAAGILRFLVCSAVVWAARGRSCTAAWELLPIARSLPALLLQNRVVF